MTLRIEFPIQFCKAFLTLAVYKIWVLIKVMLIEKGCVILVNILADACARSRRGYVRLVSFSEGLIG